MPERQKVLLNDFKRIWQDCRDDILAAVSEVGESGWYILGRQVAAFEQTLSQTTGFKYAVGCANGLDAIELSLRALNMPHGARVLTTPLSAFATTLAIIRAGGAPVFCDVDSYGLIDLDKARAILSGDKSIRFFVPVHLYGHSMDLAALRALCQEFDLVMVEDCAQSIGARSRGEPTGSVGALAATSFYPTKNLGCLGDGGAVLGNNEELQQKLKVLRDYGQSSKYNHSVLGLNSRLDELQAAIMQRAFLPNLKAWTDRRRQIAALYLDNIKHTKLELPRLPEYSESVWHLFPTKVLGERAAFMGWLKEQAIESAVHYPILIPDQAAMEGVASAEIIGDLKNARQFAECEVSLPIHPLLGDEQVHRVIDACNSWSA